MNHDVASPPLGRAAFAATRWTLVLRAHGDSGEGRAALSELCEAYYAPVLAFIRRNGHPADAAREMAQEFFARLLARGGFAGPNPALGRFRNYLLAAVRYFLRDQYALTQSEKRGGGAEHVALDFGDDNADGLQVADPLATPDAAVFDREWGVALMNRAIAALEAQHSGKRAEQLAALHPFLMGEEAVSYAETAARLGMTEGTVKVTVHRLRRRFRELLRAEVAQTLTDPAELDDELRHLCAALAYGV